MIGFPAAGENSEAPKEGRGTFSYTLNRRYHLLVVLGKQPAAACAVCVRTLTSLISQVLQLIKIGLKMMTADAAERVVLVRTQ